MVYEEALMSEPIPGPGVLSRAEEWLQEHIAPDLAKVKADVARVKALAPELKTIAHLVITLAEADPGIPPEVVADAEKAAQVIAEIATELAATGM